MRRAARSDENQAVIASALRAVGATVQHLHHVGGGCPDLLVGYRGKNYLIEIKDGGKPPSRQQLTEDQKVWHAMWRGSVRVVGTVNEALAVLGTTAPSP